MYVEQPPQNDKVYELYYSEVGRHALLTPKEERALLRKTVINCERSSLYSLIMKLL